MNAVLALNPTALAQAAASDVRHRTGRVRGPLDGIPVLVKDNVDTRDQQTTAGSRALRSRPVGRAQCPLVGLDELGHVLTQAFAAGRQVRAGALSVA